MVNEAAEKLLKNEEEIKRVFNENIQEHPERSQAYAMMGIYQAINTLVHLFLYMGNDSEDFI